MDYSADSLEIFWIMGTDWIEIMPKNLVHKGFHMLYIANRPQDIRQINAP